MTTTALDRGTEARPDETSDAPVHPAAGLFPMLLTLSSTVLVLTAKMWASTDPAAVDLSSQAICVVSIAHGMVLFVVHGHHRITMAGCFMASSAAIVGISGLLVIPDPYFMGVPRPDTYLNSALFACTLAQIAVGAFCLARPPAPIPSLPVLPDRVVRSAQISGVIVLAATVAIGDGLGAFLDGFGFSSVLLVCAATLLGRRGVSRPVDIALVLAVLIVFPTLVISGTGRLRAIALVLAVTYLFFLRHGRRWMKTMIVLLAPIALLALGIWRREYEESLSGQHGNDTGLSSMFVAIGNFGTVLHASENGLAPTLGTSFLSPLGSALPDSLVPGWIPQATGYELAAITDPEIYGTGFSTVVSVYGDLWWNFGLLGLVVGAPLLARLLTLIDDWAVRSVRRAAESPWRLAVVVLACGILGGVVDIVWSGFHTWIVRMYARVAALLVLGPLCGIIPGPPGDPVLFSDGPDIRDGVDPEPPRTSLAPGPAVPMRRTEAAP
ncbi:O-antigen polymerase [Brachybacterium phenoliresistens]|uniref:O-antigen polymerase n=1 Tax=Brachybacterium phenoliresistens TaxID=396014 RepID=UPI0031D5438B